MAETETSANRSLEAREQAVSNLLDQFLTNSELGQKTGRYHDRSYREAKFPNPNGGNFSLSVEAFAASGPLGYVKLYGQNKEGQFVRLVYEAGTTKMPKSKRGLFGIGGGEEMVYVPVFYGSRPAESGEKEFQTISEGKEITVHRDRVTFHEEEALAQWEEFLPQVREFIEQSNIDIPKRRELEMKGSLGKVLDNYMDLVRAGVIQKIERPSLDPAHEVYVGKIESSDGEESEIRFRLFGRLKNPNKVSGFIQIDRGWHKASAWYVTNPGYIRDVTSYRDFSTEGDAILESRGHDGFLGGIFGDQDTIKTWQPWMSAVEKLEAVVDAAQAKRTAWVNERTVGLHSFSAIEYLRELDDKLNQSTIRMLGAGVITGISAIAAARAAQLTVQHLSHGEKGKAIKTGLIAALGAGLGIFGGAQTKRFFDEGTVIEEQMEKIRGKR